MKQKLNTFSIVLLMLLVSGCGNEQTPNKTPNHKHYFSSIISYDNEKHWYSCLSTSCTERKDEEPHDFGEWIFDSYATETVAGSKHRKCKKCDYTETVEHNTKEGDDHVHSFDESWTTDANYHWHKCNALISVGGQKVSCQETDSKEEHSWNNGEITKAATAFESGLKTYKCTVCNYSKTEDIPPTAGSDENIGNFTFNSDITTAQKIHTTNQENFLKFTGDYYNITSSQLNSYSATGNSEASFPNQVKLTWNHNAPSGKTVKNYQIFTGQKSDLSDGYLINGTTAKSLSFYNAFLGDNYFKVIANFTDGTYETSETKIFKVDSTAPRNLKVGNMSNCRDMGGRTTVAGGKIKQGLIYRTSDPATSGVGDVSEWTKRFKIKTEIYVKDGNTSSGPLGNTVKFVNCAMDYGATPYSNMSRNAESLRKVFSILGDTNNYPLMYHCRIGTDRTGICAVAINGLLGVPFNEIIQDYSFSNFGKIDGQRYAHKTPDNNGDDIAKYIDEVLAMPGENFQEQMYYSLLSIGVPSSTLNTVIDYLTDGTKATLPNNVVVANGNSLANSGASKKTSSDYKNPDIYYEISGSSKSVSYKYTLSEAKKVTVVCYLGSTDSSDSKKLASGIDLKIDNSSKTICDKTYFKAGFGRTQQSQRTGYMFNILGEYQLDAGEHTFSISGKNSDTFAVGSLVLITE